MKLSAQLSYYSQNFTNFALMGVGALAIGTALLFIGLMILAVLLERIK